MRNYIKFVVFSISILILASGCTKEHPNQIGEGNVVINLVGLLESDENKIGKLASVQGMMDKNGVHIEALDSLEVITNAKVVGLQKSNAIEKLASTPTSVPPISTRKLAETVRYRIMFYSIDHPTNAPIILDGGAGTITADLAVGSYQWAAYSINSTTLPALNESQIIHYDDLANQDLLYASGTITVGTGDENIQLVFKRMTSVFNVSVDVIGMPGKILPETRASLKVGNTDILANAADFDVRTGKFTGNATSIPVDLSKNVEVQYDGGIYVYSIRTILTENIAANSVKLNLSPLVVELDGGYIMRQADLNVSFSHPAVDVKANNALQSGYAFNLSAVFLDKTATVYYKGVYWAPTNLIYDPTESNPDLRYKFRQSALEIDETIATTDFPMLNQVLFSTDTVAFAHVTNPAPVSVKLDFKTTTLNSTYNKYFLDTNAFWKYGAKVPGDVASNELSAEEDPCSLVYPRGVWKMPTRKDFEKLVYDFNNNTGSIPTVHLLTTKDLKTKVQSNSAAPVRMWINGSQYNQSNKSVTLIDESGYGIFKHTWNDLVLSGLGYKAPGESIMTDKPQYSGQLAKEKNAITAFGCCVGSGGAMAYSSYAKQVVHYPGLPKTSDDAVRLDFLEKWFGKLYVKRAAEKFESMFPSYKAGIYGGAYYWISSPESSKTGTAEYFSIQTEEPSLFIKHSTTERLLSSNAKGTFKSAATISSGMSKDAQMNIRCVRALTAK